MSTKPLLPAKSASGLDDVGSTVSATVINLLKNMVGAGLLNVCIAFQYASVIGGVLVMIFSAFVCTAGFLLIGFACSKTGSKTFRALWHSSVGHDSEKVVDVVLFFHTLFSCVGYITMIGDFSVKSCAGLFPGSVFAHRRELSIYVITAVAIFPLSLYRNLDSLKHTSVVGLVITALSCLYVFYDVVANAEEYGAVANVTENLWYVRPDMFKTLALFNGSFSAHYNAPTYYAELRDRSFAKFAQVTIYSFAIATLLFTAFGIAGFARFGDEVLGNVLKSYSPDDPMVQLSWFFMMVSTVFNFPHAFQRMRQSFNALRNRRANSDFLPVTLALLGLSLYMGVAFQDIAVIKMIKGATLGVSIMFVFPALIYLSLSSKELAAAAGGKGEGPADPDCKARREPRQLLRALCVLMLGSGFLQGALALMVHYKLL